MIRILTTILIALLTCPPAMADNAAPKIHSLQASFEDVLLELQEVVINRGLVVDYTGHVDEMLDRTADAAGSITDSGETSPYLHAKYIQFCSAKLTHAAVSANPQNLAICPYIIYLYETRAVPGTIHIGYRQPVFGPSKASRKIEAQINKFLQAIVDDTVQASE